MNLKIAVVVAHLDDEIIWCGQTINSLSHFGKIDIFFTQEETVKDECGKDRWRNFTNEVDIPNLKDYDLILTHGELGEYGHHKHMEVHRKIMEKYKGKVMTFGGVWDFDNVDYVIRVTPTNAMFKFKGLETYVLKYGKEISEYCYLQSMSALEAGQLFIDDKELEKFLIENMPLSLVRWGKVD